MKYSQDEGDSLWNYNPYRQWILPNLDDEIKIDYYC